MLFYILYKLGYITANILPLKCAYRLGEWAADIRYRVAVKDRKAVIRNLSVILKKDTGECEDMAKNVFRNFAYYIVDFFRMGRINKEFVTEKISLIGLERIDEALKQKKGIIALTSHIGNWEMGGVTMSLLGYDISAVALNHKHELINRFFINQREQKGLKVIRMSSVMKRCISALSAKGILALVGDRDFTNSGIMLDFFGVPTSIPKGPAMLSLRTDSVIIPVFFLRVGLYNYKFIFDKPIETNKTDFKDDEEAVRKITEQLVAVMEKYIKQYPEQWLLFRNFWETPSNSFVL
jgi:Kdo2-lipid IVA lauroyltransferase/acyltransferase